MNKILKLIGRTTNLIDLSIITKIDYFELVSLADLLIEKELLETCSER